MASHWNGWSCIGEHNGSTSRWHLTHGKVLRGGTVGCVVESVVAQDGGNLVVGDLAVAFIVG